MSLYVEDLVKNYRRDVARFERYRQKPTEEGSTAESVIYFYMQNPILTDAKLFPKIANHWAKSSILINEVLKENNIPYFHILQPNQYYPTKRVFSEAEKKLPLVKIVPIKMLSKRDILFY